MPAKGTKKVRGHTRQVRKNINWGLGIKTKLLYTSPVRVQKHFRKKPKRR